MKVQPHHLFLSNAQAVKAIALDFKGYPPQPMLFCEVLRTIARGRITYKRQPGAAGLWVSKDNQARLRWLEGKELVEFMCRTIAEAVLDADRLTSLCRLVFQAPCHAGRCPESGRPGVYIQTEMEDFTCRQCGHCCTRLNYHDGITAQDVQRFEALGRKDILDWVGTTRTSSGETAYRIWVMPGTNQFAATCPFLRNGASKDQKICAIHDIKPQVCRNYPVSRKHAQMTGCKGFDS